MKTKRNVDELVLKKQFLDKDVDSLALRKEMEKPEEDMKKVTQKLYKINVRFLVFDCDIFDQMICN